jgi:hypothetical protein
VARSGALDGINLMAKEMQADLRPINGQSLLKLSQNLPALNPHRVQLVTWRREIAHATAPAAKLLEKALVLEIHVTVLNNEHPSRAEKAAPDTVVSQCMMRAYRCQSTACSQLGELNT